MLPFSPEIAGDNGKHLNTFNKFDDQICTKRISKCEQNEKIVTMISHFSNILIANIFNSIGIMLVYIS